MSLNKKVLSTAITFFLAVSTSSTVLAATTLKLSHNHERTHPVHKSMQYMAEKVEEYTDGEVRIRLYPNAQLGTQRESMELLQNGALDIAKSNASELESFEPSYGAFNIPYMFHDREHYYRAMESEIGEKILASSHDKGFVGLTYYDAGSRSFYAKTAISSPEDLKGMKIRVQPSPTAIEMIELMGGSPTPLAFGELYTALQQGVVDAAENNPQALTSSRHGEVAKIYSQDEHAMIPDVLVISSKVWDDLPESQQVAVKKAARESMSYHKNLWTEMTEESFSEAKESMNVEFLTVEKQPFIDIVQPMHEAALKNPEIAEYVAGINALATK